MVEHKPSDVVVIGAGIVGCATAYFLTRCGMSVTICEANTVASGATGLASGGVRTQFATELETRMTLRSRELWREFEIQHDVDLEYQRVGYLTLAADEKTASELVRRRPMQDEIGLHVVEADDDLLTTLAPGIRTDDVLLAIYTPDDGFGSPADVTANIVAEARRAGAVLRQHARVQAVEGDGSRGFVVHLESGEAISCASVVNCAGHGSPVVGASLGWDLPVTAYRQHQFLTEPAVGFDASHLPNVLDPALDLYFRGEGQGVLLGISDPDEAGRMDATVTWDLLEPLATRLEHRWPRLVDLGIARGWVGCYEVTPDLRACIGGGDGAFYATGFSGHGFMHGFAAGETVAQLVAGERPPLDVSELSADRFVSTTLA
jgi:sarcosine oxidase subunit beta